MKKKIDWKWSDLPLNIATIKKIEKQMNISFPQDFKKFIMENNAGYPSKKYIYLASNENKVFNALLNLKEGGDDPSLFETYINIKDRLPKNIIPFASDPFGNYFCLNFGEYPPSICYWDHELAYVDTQRSIIPISESFSKFIDLLSD